MWWLILLESIAVLIASLASSLFYLHMLQLESYQIDGYERWLKKNREKKVQWTLVAGIGGCLLSWLSPLYMSLFSTGERTQSTTVSHIAVLVLFVGFVGYTLYGIFRSKQKKPLVFTGRMKRLGVVLAAVNVLLLLVLIVLTKYVDTSSRYVLMAIPPYALLIAVPYLPLAAAWLAQPLEDHINGKYFAAAQEKLASRPRLIKIGITGSYGKTSTKFCLQAILSAKYSVLASPASFNTPMGISSVINNQLKAEHQVFIAEMGARHPGDIKELCELVAPRFGVITSVGPQHLETFGSVEAVANTKYELIEGLPADGCAFFAADDGEVDKLYARATCEKYRAGLGSGAKSMTAENIEVGVFGSRFTLTESGGGQVRCETKLLGRHNIANIVLCCAVARKLGLSLEEIARGVRRIEPIEHRLQLIQGNLTVIDDAFNSNPVGADAALAVLAGFTQRKIIVTPGMVELGDEEAKFNYKFGCHMADTCDVAILVGKTRTKPILQGMLDSGFSKEDVHVVNDLEEATKALAALGKTDDVVLFENDLPDNYSE